MLLYGYDELLSSCLVVIGPREHLVLYAAYHGY